jgi:type I restriction enzyme S subunit
MFDSAPEDWAGTNLGAIALLGGGTTPSKSEPTYWEGGSIPWATPSDITRLPNGKNRISKTEITVTDRALRECSLVLNLPGTVLLTSRATIGYAAINDVPLCTNQGFITFRCNEMADPHFLLQWLVAKRDFLVAAAGGSTFKELSRGTAKLLPIVLPPIEEQRKIAQALQSVDAVLALNLGIEAHLWTLRKNALSELFSVPENSPGEPTVIGRLPPGWRVEPAEGVCEAVIDCKNRTPPIVEEGFAVVRTMNVRRGRFVKNNLAHTDSASFVEWTKRGLPKRGDILITREAPIGEVCAVPADRPVCLGQRMMLYRPREGHLLPGFLLYALQSRGVQEHLVRLGGGSTVGHVRVGDIRRLPLPLPDLNKQEEIAEGLRDIDDAIDRASEASNCLRELKGTLASDLLSGRVRVPA